MDQIHVVFIRWRENHWKLVFPFSGSRMELYDLAADPAEENNVADRHPDLVAKLKKKATDIVLSGRTTPGAVQANDTGYWKHLTWITEEEYGIRQTVNK